MQQVSAGSSIIQESWPHTANVAIHVIFGTLALLLGLVQLVTHKGGAGHISRGRLFIRSVWIVVTTATMGLVIFRFGAFLAVTTLEVAYWAYSGSRALQIRHTGPTFRDAFVSACGLAAVALFGLYLQTARFPWAPAVIYSTLGVLTTLCLYDLARFGFPRQWFETLWLYEHIVKMIGAHGAIVSAFAGTVLWAWHPYSQLVPSALWTAAMIGYAVHYRMRAVSRAGIAWDSKPADAQMLGPERVSQ